MAISEPDVAELHAEAFDEEEPSGADLLQVELDEEAVDEEDLVEDALLDEDEGSEALELVEEEIGELETGELDAEELDAEELETGRLETGELEASLDEILAGRLAGDELEAEERLLVSRTEDEELAQVATRQPDEFVCEGCFLLKRRELLTDAEHQLCRDCAA